MLRGLGIVGLALCVCLALAPGVAAQVVDPTTLHYVCTGTTVCSVGATTLVTGSTIPTFNITIQGATGLTPGAGSTSTGFTATGTLYIIALVPSTAPALSFSINGTAAVTASGTFSSGVLLDGGTGFFAATSFATANPNFNAYASASGQSGTTPTGFDVYVVTFSGVTVTVNAGGSTGPFGTQTLLSVGSGGITGLPAAGFPIGTVLYAVLSDGTGGSLFSSSTTVINSTPLSGSLTIVPEPGTMALFGTGLLALGGAIRSRLRKKA